MANWGPIAAVLGVGAVLVGACFGLRGCGGNDAVRLDQRRDVYRIRNVDSYPVMTPDGYIAGGIVNVVGTNGRGKTETFPIKMGWEDARDYGLRPGELAIKDPSERPDRDGFYYDPYVLSELRASRTTGYHHARVDIKHPKDKMPFYPTAPKKK